jgi:hypothetical protein
MAKSRTTKTGARRGAQSKTDLRRHIVARAVVDPAFRQRLFSKPEEVFGGAMQRGDAEALERMKKMMPALEDIVSSLAGEVLCGGGGGCGGLA